MGINSKRELQNVSPYQFEKIVASIWESAGFNTEVSKSSGDKGIDIVAQDRTQTVLIQAKRYTDGNKVGSDEVRKYATLYIQESRADKVVIATSSSFTSQAKELAQDLNVGLMNGDELLQQIRRGTQHEVGSRSSSKRGSSRKKLSTEARYETLKSGTCPICEYRNLDWESDSVVYCTDCLNGWELISRNDVRKHGKRSPR